MEMYFKMSYVSMLGGRRTTRFRHVHISLYIDITSAARSGTICNVVFNTSKYA